MMISLQSIPCGLARVLDFFLPVNRRLHLYQSLPACAIESRLQSGNFYMTISHLNENIGLASLDITAKRSTVEASRLSAKFKPREIDDWKLAVSATVFYP